MPEQTSLNDLFEELEKCTVGIKVNDSINGTGIIVSEDGLIVTCYHVVGDRDNKTPFSDNIKVILSGPEPSHEKPVTFDRDNSDAALDIAFLRLTGKFDKSGVAKLDKSQDSFGHTFYAKGFRKPQVSESGLSAKGEIRELVRLQDNILRLQIHCTEVELGMSGSALLDIDTGRVVGIISLHYNRREEHTLNFAIPVESIVKSFREIERQNPGLIPVNKFLSEITPKYDDVYFQHIDKLFVPPPEFDDIKKNLEREWFVFIIGTPQYGKTYTAIRLLWEYYIKGYKAKTVSDKSEINEITRRLLGRDEKLKNHVILFDDPIGKHQYEPNKEFERSIEKVAHITKELNTYLVITSSDEVFNQLNSVSIRRLAKYVHTLHLKQDHFSFENKRDMLLGWASARSCKWLQQDNIRNQILDYIKDDERNLPTPLTIRDFAFQASEIEANIDELIGIINRLSENIVLAFADQIRDMTEDKQLFVSIIFILQGYFHHIIKTIYEDVVTDKKDLQDAFEFERMLSYFEDRLGKIRTFNLFNRKGISFSHSSFIQAEELILIDADGYPSRINEKIYSPLLSKLMFFTRDIVVQSSAIRHFVYNFNSLPKQLQYLLSELVNKNETRTIVAAAIVHYFDKVPEGLLTKMLVELKQKAPRDLVMPITKRYNFLPNRVRGLLPELIGTLAEKNETVGLVAELLIENFNRLPPDITNVLHKVIENKNSFWGVVSALRKNLFDSVLPPQLLNELLLKSSRKEVLAEADRYEADEFARIVSISFDTLKEEVRNELMIRLIKFPYTEERTIGIILNNYRKLSQNVRELLLQRDINLAHHLAVRFDRMPDDMKKNACELLFKLSDDRYLADHSYARGQLTCAILENFDKLPSNVHDLLYKLADSQYGYLDIVKSLESNFDNLPPKFREMLIMRLTNKPPTPELVSIILTNLDILPPDLRGWVFSLVKDVDNSEDVARAISRNFDKIPLDITCKLLLKIAETLQTCQKPVSGDKDNQLNREESWITFQIISTYEIVSHIILYNYGKLQDNIKALIVEFANSPHGATSIARASDFEFHMLPEDIRNRLLLKLSEYDESARRVARNLFYDFDKLPPDLRNNLIGELASKSSAVDLIFEILISNFDKLPNPDAENLIFYLMKRYWNDLQMKYTARSMITSAINKLPKHIQEMVLELAKEK